MRKQRYRTGRSRGFRCMLVIFIVLVFAGSVTCAYALPAPETAEQAGTPAGGDPVSDLPQDAPSEPAAPEIPEEPSEQPQEPAPEPSAPVMSPEEPENPQPEEPADGPAAELPADIPFLPWSATELPPAQIVPEETTVQSAEELLELIRQPKLRSHTVTLGADFSVVLDAPLYVAEGKSLNLDLNSHTLILAGEKEDTSSLFDIGGSLTVYDSSEEMQGLLRFENALSGIRIHGTRAAFIMTSGTIETGTGAKRAILAVGGGMLTMAGGTIRGSEEGSLLKAEDTADGGAIYLNGQGTSMQFVGGSISDTAGWNGGAFYIGSGASLMMRENLAEDGSSGIGAEILNCRAALHGGAIYIAPGGVAAITGKSLAGNRAAGNGGAIAIEGGTLTLSGGQIAGNAAGAADLFPEEDLQEKEEPDRPETSEPAPEASPQNLQDAYGGGIWAGPEATLITNAAAKAHNAQIEENEAPTRGGGIWADTTASMTLSGYGLVGANTAAGVADNVYPADTESTPAFEIIPSDPQASEPMAGEIAGEELTQTVPPVSVTGFITEEDTEAGTESIDSFDRLRKALLEQEGDILLDADILIDLTEAESEPLIIPADRSVRLVLNGHSITADLSDGISLFEVLGDLTVCSSQGEMRPAGTLTLRGGDSVFAAASGASLQLEDVNLAIGPMAERGILLEPASSLIMNGGSITGGGIAQNGGALYIRGGEAAAQTTAELTNVTIQGTQATRGGAVAVCGGRLTLTNSLISACSAVRSETVRTGNGIGGGIAVESGSLKVQATQVIDCEAGTSGGALYVEDGYVELAGGLISSCRAIEGSGGGIYAEGGFLTLTDPEIRSCTAAQNRAPLYVTSFAEVITETKE